MIRAELARESWEYKNYPEGEISEMVAIYESKGFSKEEAQRAMAIMTKKPEYTNCFLDHMMLQELDHQVPGPDESPLKDGTVTFVSFMIFGSLVRCPHCCDPPHLLPCYHLPLLTTHPLAFPLRAATVAVRHFLWRGLHQQSGTVPHLHRRVRAVHLCAWRHASAAAEAKYFEAGRAHDARWLRLRSGRVRRGLRPAKRGFGVTQWVRNLMTI